MAREDLPDLDSGLHIPEIAQQMHFFLCRYFHSRQQDQPVIVRRFLHIRQVPRGVVVRHGNRIQAFDMCHAADVRRRHVVIRAGTQAGMDVQIHPHAYASRFFPGSPAAASLAQIS